MQNFCNCGLPFRKAGEDGSCTARPLFVLVWFPNYCRFALFVLLLFLLIVVFLIVGIVGNSRGHLHLGEALPSKRAFDNAWNHVRLLFGVASRSSAAFGINL
jgi:hypothetical protein